MCRIRLAAALMLAYFERARRWYMLILHPSITQCIVVPLKYFTSVRVLVVPVHVVGVLRSVSLPGYV